MNRQRFCEGDTSFPLLFSYFRRNSSEIDNRPKPSARRRKTVPCSGFPSGMIHSNFAECHTTNSEEFPPFSSILGGIPPKFLRN